MAERLEPGAETRFRLAHALGDRTDATSLERVQMEDAIRLCETNRAQDDSLGLPRARRHEASLVAAPVESDARRMRCKLEWHGFGCIRPPGAATACARRRSSTSAGSSTKRSTWTTILRSVRNCST